MWILFISLSRLTALYLPILCWIKVERVGILFLFLILKEKLSVFHCQACMLPVGLSYMAFIMLIKSLYILLKVLIIIKYWIFSNAFTVSIEMIVWFFYPSFLLIFKAFLYIHNQRRQWRPTPVLLPGKSHGLKSSQGKLVANHNSTMRPGVHRLTLFSLLPTPARQISDPRTCPLCSPGTGQVIKYWPYILDCTS